MAFFQAALPVMDTTGLKPIPNTAIEALRKVLRKQRFAHTEIHEDGYQIFMASNEAYVKPGRTPANRKPRAAAIVCTPLESGRWQWTHFSGMTSISDNPHDQKHYNKIMAEAQRGVTATLKTPMPDKTLYKGTL